VVNLNKEDYSESLDCSWIEKGLKKRESNFSNIVCFETKDPERVQQLRKYLPSSKWGKDAEIYWYTPWEGLRLFTTKVTKSTEVTKSDREETTKDPYERKLQTQEGTKTHKVVALKTSLQVMESVLKQKKSLLVLHNLEESFGSTSVLDERISRNLGEQKDLINAFRDWALNDEIRVKDSLIVLITGNLSSVLDECTSDLIVLERPNLSLDEERRVIIKNRTSEGGPLEISSPDPEKLQERLVLLTKGLNLHQLRCVLRETYDNQIRDFNLSKLKELKAEFIKRSNLLEIEEEPIQCLKCKLRNDADVSNCGGCGHKLKDQKGFRRIGGYDTVKNFITQNLVQALTNPARFEKFAIPAPRGILLFGPPGTGKTLFAKCLAQEINVPFVNLRTENLFSMWLGESGRRFGEAIHLIEQMSPAIVFIDEIDKFGKRTGTPHDSAGEETRKVFNQVLEWLGQESRKSIIVGATNRPDDLDEAFMRPGRMDYKIPILWPESQARKQVIEIHLGLTKVRPGPPLNLKTDIDNFLQELVRMTVLFSGAEIEQLITRAKRNAASRNNADGIEEQDFKKAMENFRIDIGDRIVKLKDSITQVRKHTDDATFLEEIDRLINELKGLKNVNDKAFPQTLDQFLREYEEMAQQ